MRGGGKRMTLGKSLRAKQRLVWILERQGGQLEGCCNSLGKRYRGPLWEYWLCEWREGSL